MEYSKQLKRLDGKIAVWGVGYIGLSTLSYFAKNGVKGIGIEINENTVKKINDFDDEYLNEFTYWIGFDYKYLIKEKYIQVYSNYKKLEEEKILAHLICVPTEKNGKPFMDAINDVINKIIQLHKKSNNNENPLIIIESTMIPGTAEKILNELEKEWNDEVLFCVSPRRDWFVSSDKNLTDLSRIYGANSNKANEMAKDVLGIVCKNLILAPDYRHSEIVKSIENAFRHLDITFANQLTDAYPELDIREVLKLAGTKWNVNTYYPSFGTGGYCIPLSSQYLLSGSKENEKLTLLKDTVIYDNNRPIDICNEILNRKNIKKIGILGLSYKENMKVDKSSPSVKMVEYLKDKGIKIYANDPYYSKEEIEGRFNIEEFDFKDYEMYKEFDAIIINCNHRFYYNINKELLLNNLISCKTIYDNSELFSDWEELRNSNIDYIVIGEKNWRK